MTAIDDRTSAARRTADVQSRLTVRDSIPSEGLMEYWYPGILEKSIKSRRPVAINLLGQKVAFFRDGEGSVAALADPCPHRGASLSRGRCHFKGTLTCPYHGWTFDGQGECLAVLGEGTDSPMPGQSSARARAFPTRTLKGVVFIWMGEGAPAPIEEDVPPEFFRRDALVMNSVTTWKCNWRPAMENYLDAHVFYLHRNSGRLLTMPYQRIRATLHRWDGGTRPVTQVINGRALAVDRRAFQSLRGIPQANCAVQQDSVRQLAPEQARKQKDDFQYSFTSLGGAKWPPTKIRYYFTNFLKIIRRPPSRLALEENPEWTMLHLPSTVRTDNSNYIYTRLVVPVDAQQSRVFYFHTRYPVSTVSRPFYAALFIGFYNWLYDYNFSGQDARVVEHQYYDTSESFSPTDAVPIAWRKLVVGYARTKTGVGLARANPRPFDTEDEIRVR